MLRIRYTKTYRSRNIRGKLKVCRYLLQSELTHSYIPPTVPLTRKRLHQMLADFSSVYVKPDIGSQGVGVCKISATETGYALQTTIRKRQLQKMFHSEERLLAYLNSLSRHKMIVQAAIDLDVVGSGRPYDIRSMVQRKPGGRWTCTGFLVKVGSPDKIVTNYHQGGEIWSIEQLLQRKALPESDWPAHIQELQDASLRIAHTLSARRAGMYEMGIDFAYDKQHRLWVLEVNSNHPQFHPLKKIKPSEYRRMVQFARSYGRFDD